MLAVGMWLGMAVTELYRKPSLGSFSHLTNRTQHNNYFCVVCIVNKYSYIEPSIRTFRGVNLDEYSYIPCGVNQCE